MCVLCFLSASDFSWCVPASAVEGIVFLAAEDNENTDVVREPIILEVWLQ